IKKAVESSSTDDETKRNFLRLQLRQRKTRLSSNLNPLNRHFECNIHDCNQVYRSQNALCVHKRTAHSTLAFFDSEGCSPIKKKYNIKDPQELLDPSFQISQERKPIENEATIVAHDDAVTIDIEGIGVEEEREAGLDVYRHFMAPSPDHFMGSVNSMLDQIYEYTTLVSHNSNCRDIIFTQLNQTLQLCAALCQQEGFSLESPDDSTQQELPIIPET
uniref:C2H2-type domain-containing protein n=1 Tax=Acrobeloides nanus TaxID=290746 RepID=A0A914D9H8_9BILA